MSLWHYCFYSYLHLPFLFFKFHVNFFFNFHVNWSLCEKENNCRTYQCLFWRGSMQETLSDSGYHVHF